MHRVRGDGLVQHGPLRHRGDFFKEPFGCFRQGTALFTGLLVHQLDEAFVTVSQYSGEGEDFVFREEIGDHGGPIIIPLDGLRAQDLGRPAARSGIHRLVDQPAHFLEFRFGRPPLLGFLQPITHAYSGVNGT